VYREADLENKVAVVTGGASGLGNAIALALSKAGAAVAIADINAEKGEAAASAIRAAGGRSIFAEVDVAMRTSVKAMVQRVMDSFGRLDIAINGAGAPGMRLPSAELIEEKDARRLFDIMLFGVFFCCQEEAKPMIRQKNGRIINIASISGCIVNKGMTGTAPYNAIKAGVIHMTRGLAMDWARYNITANSISPGYMRTPATEDVLSIPERHAALLSQIPLNRFGVPGDLAGAALLLASDLGGYITGHNLVVDGGVTVW
jgi:NAD(P)-dependent dehydrogenase (short-subunit alcohol dehydrogenase family)